MPVNVGTRTELVQRHYDRLAAVYDRAIARVEALLLGHHRPWAAGRARGAVLELGVGTGLNLPFYPESATVLGVDLSERMLEQARSRIEALGLEDRAEVRRADFQALDHADGSFDTIVSTYTLCCAEDPVAACREAHRLLRPGGALLMVEHGPSSNPVLRALQRVLEPWSVRAQGESLCRDPRPYLSAAGFQLEAVERSRAGAVFRVRALKVG